ncbi:hypothetical protein [Tomitella fengzijianii]|uniref:Uncharacterized protein n=1 Tax=Tomitella fengzijianii TaxID=2597660 RepID=A0A516X397_9ACTN|nr:hypothetical protein [Tomitella fengzijianii]QDQ97540.1 hypothetical protein FO059_09615 [Tomitella fengzijianii]
MWAVGVVRGVGALVLGLLAMAGAGCSSSEDATETAWGAAGPHVGDPSPRSVPAGVPPLVMLDGEDDGPGFGNQRCAEHDGSSRLEYTATRDSDQAELMVAIDLADPPRLDALSFEAGPDRWEAGEVDLDRSAVVIDGNVYRVHAPVSDAEGSSDSEVGVLFSCSR